MKNERSAADQCDYIIVGSGINSLVCAALLAKAGKSVKILEREDIAGGCIKSGEITAPGFTHDLLSGWHPLFVLSPAYAELGDELHARGLTYLNTDVPTACVTPDGDSAYLYTAREKNIAELNRLSPGDGDGFQRSVAAIEQSAELTFGLLGNEVRRFATARLLFRELRRRGLQGTMDFFGDAMASCRSWLDTHFNSNACKTLFAPWILHTGLSPDAAFSGHMGKLIAFSLETAGMPVVKGGSYRLVEAFQQLIGDHGGEIICAADVTQIRVRQGRATGAETADGFVYQARRGVICNVTPTQLYRRLLSGTALQDPVLQAAEEYRYGRGDMQVHIAMDEPPQWCDAGLAKVPLVHVTESLDSIARAIAQAEAGFLPAKPTVVVGQPTAVDPSRAPNGKWILWLQLQELPRRIKGDELGEIDPPDDGSWNESIRERFAKRVLERLSRVIHNLHSSQISRTVLSPADLEAMNVNLVGGDPYSGDCALDQFFAWRPFKSSKNHETPVKNLYHIGASTHPGPGLGGGSGYMVGKILSR